MSQSASQASIFYRDVEATGKTWTTRDENGFPAPKNRDGIRSMPFWSSKSRVDRIIKNVPAYESFEPVEFDLTEFYDYWLQELKSAELMVGINWSGKQAVGYDLNPNTLIKWIDRIRPKNKSLIDKIFKRKKTGYNS
ncbi:MAG: DUF2750 domain-containing protein [Cryomorphaceae bacterium]|nr:DUF2750 domain-containing protein [Cryomorphaceae bacterium]